VTASVHLRGIVIAGVLAAVALALGLVTLAMNQTASQAAVPPKVLPLKLRHPARAVRKTSGTTTSVRGKNGKAVHHKAAARRNPNYVAALKAGLPRSIARALAARKAVVVELTSGSDHVAEIATGEALVGGLLGGAAFVGVNVDKNGGDVEVLTRLLGQLPVAPTALIYTRPATLAATLPGFNDRSVIQQAVATALSAQAAGAAGVTGVAGPKVAAGVAPTAPAATATTPAAGATTP
jgi:hypothetical protein